jgi:hypothetical protein
MDSSSAFSVFWLAGMAGTGKTTIAKSFCEWLADTKKLGANFFVSRQVDERRDVLNIIRTWAYDLAFSVPSTRTSLLAALRSLPDISAAPLEDLVTKLISEPLADGLVRRGIREVVVLVIDALDECRTNYDIQSRQLVPLLVSALKDLPVKLFVTSRMEKPIQDMFRRLAPASLRLHEIEKDIVTSDVRAYLRTQFADIRRDHDIGDQSWPSPSYIDALTEQAGHLFIYASTVTRYIGNRNYNPRTRLDQILTAAPSLSGSAYRLVDSLYLKILCDVVTTDEDDELDLSRRLRSVLGAVILVQHPLRSSAIAQLLAIDPHEVKIVLERLSSVLLCAPEAPVDLFHQSFPDCILDVKRCPDPRFHIVPSDHHHALAAGCLAVMNLELREDICGIGDITLANAEISDLNQRLASNVSEALRYAVISWMFHVERSTGETAALLTQLRLFCDAHMFHWLEVLSLLGQLSIVSQGIAGLLTWLRVSTLC